MWLLSEEVPNGLACSQPSTEYTVRRYIESVAANFGGCDTELLAHPFSLRPNATVATVSQDSDAANAQLLTALVLTRYNERALSPGYGTSDPVMVGLDATELVAQATYWGPQVKIVAVDQQPSSADSSIARIEFQ